MRPDSRLLLCAVAALVSLAPAVAAAQPRDPRAIDGLITSGHYAEAEQAARALAAEARAAGDLRAAARATLQQSDALYYLGKPALVDKLNREALALAERAADDGAIGQALYNLSFAHERTQPARMIAMLQKAVPYAARAGDRGLEMHIENAFGTAYWSAGPYSAAIDHFSRSAAIAEELGNRHGAVIARANVALMHERRGEHETAIREWEPLIAALRAEKANAPLAQQLGNLGIAHRSLGNLERALALFEEALQIQRQNGYKRSEAVLLGEAASAYWDLGDAPRAEVALRRALEISDELEDRRNAVSLLTTLARWRIERGRMDEAAAIARDARERADALGDPEGIAEALSMSARADAVRNRPSAFRLIDQALVVARRLGDPYIVGHALAFRAELLDADGQHQEATIAWQAAIEEHERTRTRRSLPLWRARLGHAYAALGRRSDARREFDAALRLIDDLDAGLSIDRFRIPLFRDVARVFRQYASDLVAWGEPADAWSVLGRGRARELALRVAQTVPVVALSDAECDAIARLTDLQRQLQEGRLTPSRRADLLRQVDELEAEYERARLAARRDRPAAVVLPFQLPQTDALILEYAVNGEELLVFSARSGRISVRRIPGAGELLERVRRFIEQASDGSTRSSVAPLARDVADALLGPEVRASATRRLIVVADDVLHYVPFGALVDKDGHFLSESIAISTTPSLAMLNELRTHAAAGDRVLAVGNTRFTGTTFMGQPLPDLPSSADEARMVAAHGASSDLLIEASETRLRDANLSQYGVVHFATHALIYDAQPARSGIVLASDAHQDGLLQARELYGVRARWGLAVLAGCDTARGAIVSGEGVLGLSHALFSAGAASIVMTLWKVSDEATGVFMSSFYDALADRMSIADALAEAQRHMITSRRWQHPVYWAGFVAAGHADQRLPLRHDRRQERVIVGAASLLVIAAAVVVWRRGQAAARS